MGIGPLAVVWSEIVDKRAGPVEIGIKTSYSSVIEYAVINGSSTIVFTPGLLVSIEVNVKFASGVVVAKATSLASK
jgi:hypothetical protein